MVMGVYNVHQDNNKGCAMLGSERGLVAKITKDKGLCQKVTKVSKINRNLGFLPCGEVYRKIMEILASGRTPGYIENSSNSGLWPVDPGTRKFCKS